MPSLSFTLRRRSASALSSGMRSTWAKRAPARAVGELAGRVERLIEGDQHAQPVLAWRLRVIKFPLF
jgi:hypothetical protein